MTGITVDKVPSLIVLPKEKGDPVFYDGTMKIAPIKTWLEKYALPKAEKSDESKDKKAEKKDKKKKEEKEKDEL